MITSIRRLVLALLIGSGLLFSGAMVVPPTAQAQEQPAPKKKVKKSTKKKAKKSTKKAKRTKKNTTEVK